MPRGGPGVPHAYTPPQTRVFDMWHKMWFEMTRNSPKRLATARQISAAARTRKR